MGSYGEGGDFNTIFVPSSWLCGISYALSPRMLLMIWHQKGPEGRPPSAVCDLEAELLPSERRALDWMPFGPAGPCVSGLWLLSSHLLLQGQCCRPPDGHRWPAAWPECRSMVGPEALALCCINTCPWVLCRNSALHLNLTMTSGGIFWWVQINSIWSQTPINYRFYFLIDSI